MILLVEDELPIRNALKFMLEKQGYEVKVAGNGQDGLKIALAENPDLILTDIIMPKMDGLKMVKEIHKAKSLVPILVLTNLDNLISVEESLEGIDVEMIIKSNTPLSAILEKVKTILK